ncbi:ROK family protein [Thermocrinis minervae]|uniref:Glucokinase n=1 Tax=Thermocrinis minervae TaxID=381751 RepID=A0A1M6STS7_9AQUI|nr:ROK family protein [Thermocrinis minervae]SHK48095.1 glucokinase [Thermocrinis minervae]
MKKGIDVGGSYVKVLWEDGRREKFPVREFSKDREAFLKRILQIIKEGNPEKVGVSVAGFTSTEGVIYRSPNIPALDGVKLLDLLKHEGLEAVVMNDVSCGAFGEWFFEERNSKVLLLVAVGTGLGAGLVIEGRPFLGARGSALELGHHIVEKGGKVCSCGRKGCLEAYCSSYGLERIYRELSGKELKDYEIVNLAKEGEKEALAAVEVFKEYLLVGLMNAVHILNPDLVVLAGGLIEGMKEFLHDLEERLISMVERLPAEGLRVKFSSCGEYCMARGALALALT